MSVPSRIAFQSNSGWLGIYGDSSRCASTVAQGDPRCTSQATGSAIECRDLETFEQVAAIHIVWCTSAHDHQPPSLPNDMPRRRAVASSVEPDVDRGGANAQA